LIACDHRPSPELERVGRECERTASSAVRSVSAVLT
jgi:hypothetical protein